MAFYLMKVNKRVKHFSFVTPSAIMFFNFDGLLYCRQHTVSLQPPFPCLEKWELDVLSPTINRWRTLSNQHSKASPYLYKIITIQILATLSSTSHKRQNREIITCKSCKGQLVFFMTSYHIPCYPLLLLPIFPP